MKSELNLKENIFAGFIELKQEGLFQVYLINPTKFHYSRDVKVTGASYENMNSTICQKEQGTLLPNTALLVDESDVGELDLNIWYIFDLYEKENEMDKKPQRVSLSISWHDAYRKTLTDLPILNKAGRILELIDR